MADFISLPELPPLHAELPRQPWVEALLLTDREAYDRLRAADIATNGADITEELQALAYFDGASKEAVGRVALRLATSMRDGYELGVQIGKNRSE